jgi:membrane protein YqaA with SNARE-associated domain
MSAILKLGFLKRLYHRILSLSAHPAAAKWLAVIAFIESFFFPIPADVLFIPMALAAPHKAFRYALIATVASCLGSMFGYGLGMFGYEHIARPMLEALGKADALDHYRALLQADIVVLWGLLLSSGFAHLPPIKIVTILSGFSDVNFLVFCVSAFISRALRFFLFAWLLKTYGEPIRLFIEKKFGLVVLIGLAALVALYMVIKQFS